MDLKKKKNCENRKITTHVHGMDLSFKSDTCIRAFYDFLFYFYFSILHRTEHIVKYLMLMQTWKESENFIFEYLLTQFFWNLTIKEIRKINLF